MVPVTRRWLLQLLGATFVATAAARVLGDPPAVRPPTAADAAPPDEGATPGERRYRGTATTRFGPAASVGPDGAAVRRDVAVTVTSAREATTRPVAMTVDDPSGAASGHGAVTAEVAFDDDASPGTDRHWETRTRAPGAFGGVLRTPDPGANVLTSRRELVPGHPDSRLRVAEPMAPGTTLAGRVDADRVGMRISGNTVNRFAGDLLDGTRPFHTVIRAARARNP